MRMIDAMPKPAGARPGLGLTIAIAAMAAVIFPSVSSAFSWGDMWSRSDQQGAALYREGDMEGAARKFTDDSWRAAAWYKAGEYDKVLRALSADDSVPARYNKANALTRLGQLSDALSAYDEILRDDPGHEDARFNRDLVAKMQEQQGLGDDSSDGQPGEDGEPGEGADEGQAGEAGDSVAEAGQQQSGQGQESADGDGQQMSAVDPASADEAEGAQAGVPDETAEAQGDEEQTAISQQDEQQEQQEEGDEETAAAMSQQGEADSMMLSGQRRRTEQDMAVDLWLRNIEAVDDTFLRRKFQHQHQQKQRR